MQEKTFTFIKDRSPYYDLIIIFTFIAVFIVGYSFKLNSMYWWITLSFLVAVSIIYSSGRRVKIKVTNEILNYKWKSNEFSSIWADLQFIEMANYPSTMGFNDMSHGSNAFRIITKSGTSDWMCPYMVTTDSWRKSGDQSNKIGDNISYLFDIIKQKSGVTPGLGSSFYNRRAN